MNYRFVVRQKKIQHIMVGNLVQKQITFICVEDKTKGIILPHPFTSFIKEKYINKSLSENTQNRYAHEIVKFLNFVMENIENKNEIYIDLFNFGLRELRLEHGAEYINFLTYRVELGEIVPNYVHDIDRCLTKFYTWLSEKGILKENITIKYETKRIRGKNTSVAISPFKFYELDIQFPRKENDSQIKVKRLHDFGIGRFDLINLFLRVAEMVAPDIALGIAFQFYGGLRRGEVVNLLRNSIKEPYRNGSGAFVISISDNWNTLFPNNKLILAEQVKKNREQVVFKVNILLELYEKHKKNLLVLEKKGLIKDNRPLFCSFTTGKAITGMAYWKRINKVKDEFLRIVYENNLEDYNFLISKPWSTHIGRGIYTNMLYYMGWTDSEIAIARGDAYIDSAKQYIESKNIEKKAIEAIEFIAKASLDAENKRKIE